MDDVQRKQLEIVLRRLHAGLKTFQLYSPTHAAARSTVQDVTTTLRGYLQRYGPIPLQVGKDRLQVGDVALSDGGMNAFAFFLYARNLASLAITPGVTDREVAEFLRILSQDRQTLESSGGVEHHLSSNDLPHLDVRAVALKEGTEDALSEAGIIRALTRTRRLSPEQRDVILSVLRDGPGATAALLVAIQHAAGGLPPEGEPVEVEPLVATLETIDRAILDQPLEDQEALQQSLARGVLQLDDRTRGALAPELLSQATDGGSGRAILSELTGEEIAMFVLGPVGQGDMAARLSQFLSGLHLPDERTAAVTAFLEAALAAGGSKVGSVMTAVSSPGQPDAEESDGWAAADPALLTINPSDETALEHLRAEVSERAVAHDAISGLINLLALQERPEENAETEKAVALHLESFADSHEFDSLSIALQRMQEAREGSDTLRATIDAELTRILNAGLLDRLVQQALRERAEAPGGVLRALGTVRGHAVPHLIRLLEREPAAPQRLRICRLLTEIAAGQAGLIGPYLTGASWYLIRNLAAVLGELRDASAIGYLTRLANHPEYRVRWEAIDALRRFPPDQQQDALLAFLHDADPRIQRHLIDGWDTPSDARIVVRMQQIIGAPVWSADAVAAKIAAMGALARMRVDSALPALRRIAQARIVFGQGRRTVRDAARRIVETWERRKQQPA